MRGAKSNIQNIQTKNMNEKDVAMYTSGADTALFHPYHDG